jgi:hypothetical protein
MSNPPCAGPHVGWSEVRANDQVIRYRRCGAGRPVLVLRRDWPDDSSPPSQLEALGGRFRLLVPELPVASVDLAPRLAAFLDGLGVADVAVLAFGELCLPALELALLVGDQVGRLALVLEGQSKMPDLDGALLTAPGQAALPLVLIRDDGRGTEDMEALADFLGGAGPDRVLARP